MRFMGDTSVSLELVREDAIDVIMEQRGLTRHAAAMALSETADQLAVDVHDLAGLVSAAAAGRAASTPVRRTEGSTPLRRWTLALVDPPSKPRPGPHKWLGADLSLTRRESEVLTLIVAGLGNQTIAEELHLSINSIKSHIRTLYPKMGVKPRSQAVAWGIDHGFRTFSLT